MPGLYFVKLSALSPPIFLGRISPSHFTFSVTPFDLISALRHHQLWLSFLVDRDSSWGVFISEPFSIFFSPQIILTIEQEQKSWALREAEEDRQEPLSPVRLFCCPCRGEPRSLPSTSAVPQLTVPCTSALMVVIVLVVRAAVTYLKDCGYIPF